MFLIFSKGVADTSLLALTWVRDIKQVLVPDLARDPSETSSCATIIKSGITRFSLDNITLSAINIDSDCYTGHNITHMSFLIIFLIDCDINVKMRSVDGEKIN